MLDIGAVIYPFLPQLFLVWGGLMLGLMSPGPSFILIANIALTNRHSAIFVAIGCGFGSAIWALLTSFGLTALLVLYPDLIKAIRLLGGLYLLWLAFGAFKKVLSPTAGHLAEIAKIRYQRGFSAFIKGLLIHLTNPKAAFVWLSLTALAVTPQTPIAALVLLVIVAFLLSLGWHLILALVFSTVKARTLYTKFTRSISALFTAFFAALGVHLLWGLIAG